MPQEPVSFTLSGLVIACIAGFAPAIALPIDPECRQDSPAPSATESTAQAENEWSEIETRIQEKLLRHKEQMRTGKSSVSFQSDIGRIGEFFRKYQKSAPDIAWAAKTFLAVQILHEALQQQREAIETLEEVAALAEEPLVAGIAALHAGEILLSSADEVGLRRLSTTYKARKTRDAQIEKALETLLVRAALLPGHPFPELEIEDLSGQLHKVSQYRGRMVVLVVFNVDAPPCAVDLGRIMAAKRELEPRRMTFLGISVDRDRTRLETFLAEKKVDFPVGFDGKEWETPAVARLAVSALPVTFAVDPAGKIIHSAIRGASVADLLREAYRTLDSQGAFPPLPPLPDKRRP